MGVIHLRSIQPLDEDTILASVEKTGRLVVVNEAPVRGGFGGEVAVVVANKALGLLDAPIQRVGAPGTPGTVRLGPRGRLRAKGGRHHPGGTHHPGIAGMK